MLIHRHSLKIDPMPLRTPAACVFFMATMRRCSGPIFIGALAACGGGSLTVGAFAPIAKTEGDAPFALVAPTSRSPVPFTFSSSDTSVATVNGNLVTILRAGTSTIVAQQASSGTWSATSTSTLLTVAPLSCVAPATREGGLCVAPAMTGNLVTRSARTWMPVRHIDTWANANAYCVKTVINGQTGWRLPGTFELTDLAGSGQIAGQGWVLAKTWTSIASVDAAKVVIKDTHDTVDLANGAVGTQADQSGAYVACVR